MRRAFFEALRVAYAPYHISSFLSTAVSWWKPQFVVRGKGASGQAASREGRNDLQSKSLIKITKPKQSILTAASVASDIQCGFGFEEEEQRNGRAFEPAEEASDVELATTQLATTQQRNISPCKAY